jgi:hypothetical protein
MDVQLHHAAVELEARAFLTLSDARGARVLCLSGELWITQDGDPNDHFVAPGAVFDITAPGTVVVQAEEPSRAVLLEALPAPRPSPQDWPSLVRRFIGPARLEHPPRAASLHAI